MTSNGDDDPLLNLPHWHMEMVEEDGLDGLKSFHADVYRRGEWVCRIALAGHFPDRAAARDAAKQRLRKWLDDYLSRPHTGDTGFQIL